MLVVDDEPEIAELIASQLAALDVQTTVALSGAEALERLRTAHYDAVTLDILMPEMDGFEVLRQIRSDRELAGIPIVFVSVFSGRQELSMPWPSNTKGASRSVLAGVKPFSMAAEYRKGLKPDPGRRFAWVARL